MFAQISTFFQKYYVPASPKKKKKKHESLSTCSVEIVVIYIIFFIKIFRKNVKSYRFLNVNWTYEGYFDLCEIYVPYRYEVSKKFHDVTSDGASLEGTLGKFSCNFFFFLLIIKKMERINWLGGPSGENARNAPSQIFSNTNSNIL